MPKPRTTSAGYRKARALRHHPTEAEARLWTQLRGHRLAGVGFRRQHAIGPFIVDFCVPRCKLVVELDGSQHLEQEVYDAERTAYLEAQGYRVMRFYNNQVMKEMEAVLGEILEALNSSFPTTPP
jgi:very-short-patch-repair endonuclease